MMKLLLRTNPNGMVFSFRSLFYSTKTLPTLSWDPSDSLYRRISRAGDPAASIVLVLDQWLEQGKDIKQSELQKIIKQLRKYKRFKHALEMSEWMSDQRNLVLSPGDVAVRLDLVSKVHGLEQAEKYFNSIPSDMRGYKAYGALLNCYVNKKSLEKAEAVMQKMRELLFVKGSLSYNAMLRLYSQLRKHEKMDMLMQEMEEKGIDHDQFTYYIRLNSYAAVSDVEGMEKLLKNMEADPHVIMDWNVYCTAANGYLKAGLIEKALPMLKRSQQLVTDKTRKSAYEVLLTLYASAGKKEEVYRIWNMYKNMGSFYNSGYLSMLSSLVKLDDIDGAERILEEWESGHVLFDTRVLNLMISSYCNKGLLEKAEAYVNRLMENGKVLDATTWDRLATGYRLQNQMEKALETMKKTILASRSQRPGWKLNRFTLAACLDYLKGQGDAVAAAKLLRLLSEQGHVSVETYDRLLININNGNLSSKAIHAMEWDEQNFGGETNENSVEV